MTIKHHAIGTFTYPSNKSYFNSKPTSQNAFANNKTYPESQETVENNLLNNEPCPELDQHKLNINQDTGGQKNINLTSEIAASVGLLYSVPWFPRNLVQIVIDNLKELIKSVCSIKIRVYCK